MPKNPYYEIAKPGMVYGNLIPAICAFLFGAHGNFLWPLFFAMLIGLGLVMAAGCVFNNVLDRDIDGSMARTKKRATVTGEISGRAAVIYGTILAVAGFIILLLFVNTQALIAAGIGFFFYVVMYTLWWKRKSAWGTEVGSVAGAMPAVVGYVAATGRFDVAAFVLFAIMAIWQMPHFYAVAIRRMEDYAAAKIPVLSVSRGIKATKFAMLGYLIAFALITPLPWKLGYVSVLYLIVAVVLSFGWLSLWFTGVNLPDKGEPIHAWAGKMFKASLIVMITLFVTIAMTRL
jgi:protoheme IX farnesyltransferase